MARDPERTPLLALTGVTKTFGHGATAVDVLAGVDLTLAPGEALAVVGPSGSGKSTLLEIAGSLAAPTSGEVRFDGEDLARLDDEARAALRNRAIGFVFQHHHLLPQLSALENVLVPGLATRRTRADRTALARRAEELLARVGLADRMTHLPAALSGGERQRVAFVRALVLGPRLVLADEPTGSLDPKSAEVLGDVLLEARERDGVALLVVTHSDRLAARMPRAVRLEAGRLVAVPQRGAPVS